MFACTLSPGLSRPGSEIACLLLLLAAAVVRLPAAAPAPPSFADLSLSATLYNLFAERYRVPNPQSGALESIEQDRRTFRVKFTHRF